MKIYVNGENLAESAHAGKRILIDTMILCYAHDHLSPHNTEASLIMKASIKGIINAHLTYQNLAEFYSVITGKRVEQPVPPAQAARLCRLYGGCVNIKILPPTEEAYGEAFDAGGERQTKGGDIFDAILAYTAKGRVDSIWTSNVSHFEPYTFLEHENPLTWSWEEKKDP